MTTSPDPAIAAMALQVAEMHQKLTDLELSVEALAMADAKKHKVKDSIRWWDITDEAKELEIARLRGWERDILVPVLGYHMIPCWPIHLPAVQRMEIMFELWRMLWLSRRTPALLASQAEYFLRQLPGLADDIRTICRSCDHVKDEDETTEEVAA
jgi:hypothetical protein